MRYSHRFLLLSLKIHGSSFFLIYGYKIKDPFNSFLMGIRSQILIVACFCCLQHFNVKVFLIVACGQKKELYYELDEILVWTN